MITKEMLLTASNYSRRCENYRGVLTTKEAEDYLKENNEIIEISNVRKGMIFFTDDHCFGVHVIPDDWVPCTARIPQQIRPRKGLSDGVIRTAEQYISIFDDWHQITSIDELIHILSLDNYDA